MKHPLWFLAGILAGILLTNFLFARAHAAEPADLDRLAHAVAVAETQNCTTGTALSKKNCHGIMTWKNGHRAARTFRSTAESFAAFKDLWTRKYGGRFPTISDAILYSGSDRATSWLATVRASY